MFCGVIHRHVHYRNEHIHHFTYDPTHDKRVNRGSHGNEKQENSETNNGTKKELMVEARESW